MESEGGEQGGSSGGPAPFLVKTYEMVDDSSTDDVVSWSASSKSFVVWNHADFSARLLPTYFKHNNFSSFIRQLNTYGFRKIDPERWEFANEDFIKGRKDLLKNIRRRKPIHSHSLPPGGAAVADAERAALQDEIDQLRREKSSLEATLWKFEQQCSEMHSQFDDVERRVADMENRQLKMITFLQQAMLNPRFVETLAKMAASSSMDFSVIHKKRRLPLGSENSLCDDHCSTSKFESGLVLNQDFCDKLKLELCSAFQDRDLVMASTQSSIEDTGSSREKQFDYGRGGASECLLPLTPETLELCDTGASICPTKNLSPRSRHDNGDGSFPCHLSLTLASSGMEMDRSSADQREENSMELDKVGTDGEELGTLVLSSQNPAAESGGTKAAQAQQNPRTSGETQPNHPVRVNDVFWEQFLTERPGSDDTEEANSSSRAY
ncbi:heat stress transcription factor A-5-like [Zingiber officinale]|uniref:HSF-type DNA-binding domain-containing protein n=1 Tax=Zingiber officinale TaxID=94328 RepID=A0A8J5L2C7_ZINOF|nr:heat stress transcription factor A-5-like [Zingiber officinale]KAG6508879.1 hypothetical protein ZIOFF_034261 [Zingiber officinale]